MREKINNFFKINFVKDTATLQVGTFFSTGLTFIASVVFARFLGPDNYGQYALIFAYVALVETFMSWGASSATLTVLAEAWANQDKKEVKRIVIYFVKISLLASLTIGLLAIIFSPAITQYFYQSSKIGQLARWLLLAGIVRFMFALLTTVLQAIRKIKQLTIIENINKIVYIIVPISLVLFGLGLNGIVWGNFLSALIFFIFSLYFYQLLLKRTDLLPTFKEIIWGLKNISIKRYFKFGFSIAIDKNLASFYSILPMVFLGMFVATAEIAYFKIALGYIGLSLMFLKPISRLLAVQLPKSKTYGFRQLKTHFFKTSFYSFVVITIVVIPMLFLSRYLVEIFYGVKYLPAVKIIYLLWPYAIVTAWGVGHGAIYRTINKVKVAIIINIFTIIIGAPVFFWLIKNYGITGMVITTICWGGATTLINFIYLINYFRNIPKETYNNPR